MPTSPSSCPLSALPCRGLDSDPVGDWIRGRCRPLRDQGGAVAASVRSSTGRDVSIASVMSSRQTRTRYRRLPPTPRLPRSSTMTPTGGGHPQSKRTRSPSANGPAGSSAWGFFTDGSKADLAVIQNSSVTNRAGPPAAATASASPRMCFTQPTELNALFDALDRA